MLAIVTPEEMRAIDAASPDGLDVLIERAGRATARAARRLLGGVYGRRVVVIAGKGNNGADALVAGRVLEQAGVRVQVVGPADALPGRAHLVIDGAIGTSLNRPFVAPALDRRIPVLAVDISSGVDGLTGELPGTAHAAVHTVTFGALKPGLLLHPGATLAGDVEVASIGLDVSSARSWLFGRSDAVRWLPHQPVDNHKWKRAVLVVGGSPGMTGAPLLAGEAALRSGAGYAAVAMPGVEIAAGRTEAVLHTMAGADWHDELPGSDRFGAMVLGPGLGRSEPTARSVRAALAARTVPTVVDGDALRLLDADVRLDPSVVLTPHDGEFAALGGTPGPDRFAATRALAAATGAVVLRKGPLTIVAAPDGRCYAVARGDQRLATAGSGDVLAGIIAAQLSGGVPSFEAAALGAWLHGDAGHRRPPAGMVASDLLAALPDSMSQLATP